MRRTYPTVQMESFLRVPPPLDGAASHVFRETSAWSPGLRIVIETAFTILS